VKTSFINATIQSQLARPEDSTIYFAQFERPLMADRFFQTDCTKPLYNGHTVILSALQLSIWMGFKEVYLLGVDFSFRQPEPHFYKSSESELSRSQSASLIFETTMRRSLAYAANHIQRFTDAKLRSVGPNRSFSFIENVQLHDIA
jgi:hypothetical protein